VKLDYSKTKLNVDKYTNRTITIEQMLFPSIEQKWKLRIEKDP